jgi:hypothetical protein
MKRYRLNMHLSPFFGDIQLSKIATFDVERYKKQRVPNWLCAPMGPAASHPMAAKPNRPRSTANWRRCRTCSTRRWNGAGWIIGPATIKRLKEHSGRITYLTVEQIERLLKAAEGDQNRQIYPFIRIGLETSMRKTEILEHPPRAHRPATLGHLHPQGQGRRS